MKPLVVITGATGRLGRSVCAAFRTAGYHVAAVTRKTSHQLDVDELLTAFDLKHIPPPSSQPAAVVHLAAETSRESAMFDVNVAGSQAIVEWALRHQARQVIYMSSVGVYGSKHAGLVTPAMVRRPANTYEKTKTVAEELILKIGSGGSLPVTVLQPSNVFGVGSEWPTPLLQLMRTISRGRFMYVGREATPFNYVDVRDVAQACVAALGTDAHGRTFILNDPLPLSRVVEIVADAAEVKPPSRRLPYAVAFTAAAAMSGVSLLSGRQVPIDLSRLRALTNQTTYDGSDITTTLGFRYPVGTDRGLQELAHHYRDLSLL
jgi:nucleoside-diphosphate-sugar epimerase